MSEDGGEQADEQDEQDGRVGQGEQDEQGRGEGQSTVERAVAALSVVVTLALLGFLAWQAWTVPPAETPSARITDTSTLSNGSAVVVVEFVNDQDVGVLSATVAVDCGSPPPVVRFEHVPAGGRGTAHVVCPSNTTASNATVVTWQEP